MVKKALTLVKRIHADSLYRNSLYLMASTYIMSFIGFFFWMIVTRLYSAEDVGLATTLISVTGLISSFSLFGLNTALIRFLPGARNKNNMINTAFSLIAIGTVLVTLVFLAGLPVFSPRLQFIFQSPVFVLSFIVFMVIVSINSITDSVFIANRDTKYIPVTNTVMSLVKLVMPAFLVGLGAYGIFYSFVLSVNVAMVISIFLLTLIFSYRFLPRIDIGELRKMWKFSFGNYLAGFFGSLPSMIIPIIIINSLGPKMTAYYFMPSMITNLLFTVPRATTQSLFAEGSFSSTDLVKKIIKAIRIILVILIPSVALIVVFGRFLLLVFGKDYSSEGITYLQVSSISAIFSIPNYIIGIVLNIERRVRTIILLAIFNSVSILSLTTIFLPFGLLGVAIAGILSQTISTALFLIIFYTRKNK